MGQRIGQAFLWLALLLVLIGAATTAVADGTVFNFFFQMCGGILLPLLVFIVILGGYFYWLQNRN